VDSVAQNFPFPVVYKIHDFQRKEQSVQFAFSEVTTNASKYFSYRALSRTANNPWDATEIVYGKQIVRKKVFVIPNGEDPRLFFYKQEPWLYFQIFNELESDVEIRVKNLKSDIEYNLRSPLGFNGKNWVPFEKNGELHFIYSLEPLVVLKMSIDSQGNHGLEQILSTKDFNPGWETNFDKSIGQVRGGTPGVIFGKRIIGFTHQVHNAPNYQFHTLGLFTLNSNNFELELIALSELSPGFLIDPYGINLSKKNIHLYCSVVEGDLHSANSDVANVVFSFKTKKLKSWLI
jgi:hypothetical protein